VICCCGAQPFVVASARGAPHQQQQQNVTEHTKVKMVVRMGKVSGHVVGCRWWFLGDQESENDDDHQFLCMVSRPKAQVLHDVHFSCDRPDWYPSHLRVWVDGSGLALELDPDADISGWQHRIAANGTSIDFVRIDSRCAKLITGLMSSIWVVHTSDQHAESSIHASVFGPAASKTRLTFTRRLLSLSQLETDEARPLPPVEPEEPEAAPTGWWWWPW